MADTNIEWATKVWNPVRGCSIVSKGCTNCYAMKQAHRFAGPGGKYEGLTRMSNGGPVWTGEVRTVPEMLDAPLHWKKPQRVFVNSMSDLFHEDVPDPFILAVFSVMERAPQHTFQVLTKRAERMKQVTAWVGRKFIEAGDAWPLRNVWLGVSVEDQATADERIPLLLETPAALRWISYEPALGAVDFSGGFADRSDWCDLYGHSIGDHDGTCMQCSYDPNRPYLDWIVIGGESGHGARPFDIQWARSTVERCRAAGIACFVKQLGAKPLERQPSLDKGFAGRDLLDVMTRPRPPQMDGWGRITTETETFYQRHLDLKDRKGGDPDEWPSDLRVREWPEVRA